YQRQRRRPQHARPNPSATIVLPVRSDWQHDERRSPCSQCWYPNNGRIHYSFSSRPQGWRNVARASRRLSALTVLADQRLVTRVVSNGIPPPRMIVLRNGVLLRTL